MYALNFSVGGNYKHSKSIATYTVMLTMVLTGMKHCQMELLLTVWKSLRHQTSLLSSNGVN